jgi:hypothetical protein
MVVRHGDFWGDFNAHIGELRIKFFLIETEFDDLGNNFF